MIRGRGVVGPQPDERRHEAPSAVAPVSRLEGRRVRRYNNPTGTGQIHVRGLTN